MRLMLTLLVALLGVTALTAQNLTRRPGRGTSSRPKVAATVAPAPADTLPAAATVAPAPADTLPAAYADSLSISGFEKPLRSRHETFFVTNSSGSHVGSVEVEIDYRDLQGRQLHRAVHTVYCDLPPGQTRRLQVPAMDREGLMYYRLSPVPRGARHATPFDAVIRILTLTR